MLHKLTDHSPDLKKLRDEGYEVFIKGAHVLVSHIPYVNSRREICYGTLVTDLTVAGDKAGVPRNHVIFFIGEQPCHKNGAVITALVHGQNKTTVGEGIEIDRSFSNKPPNGYTDYYHKFKTYIDIISGPAQSIDSSVKAQTFRLVESNEYDPAFNYPDTNSSRAQISEVSEKLRGHKIAIIGLGGTGSYLLDFISKTPVSEIHIYDGDDFLLHNAFRSPGAPEAEVLKAIKSKVGYFLDIYSRMHKGIKAHYEYISESNLEELARVDFVFICIDNGSIKRQVINYLNKTGIGFIDVGMGIEISDNNSLFGIVRVTSSLKGETDHIFSKGRISFAEADQVDLYGRNIQIAELNALNAALAIIKWKKMTGFFFDADKELHSLYSIDDNSIINDDISS
ncbi:MAG: ThiF family adenylyltransferase [Bacteroidota bacterium]|nr:ThiF family adenylyltransferase [Bacteroidota bacterium]